MDVVYLLEELLKEDLPYASQVHGAPTKKRSILSILMANSREVNINKLERIYRHVKTKFAASIIRGRSENSERITVLFNSNDVNIINELLSEIRSIIKDTIDLTEDHKLRLLKIVAAFQREVDKPKGSLRVFLDGLIEASEALGEAGEKIKPAVDRIREIFNIADKKTVSADQIEKPEERKKLPAPEKKVS